MVGGVGLNTEVWVSCFGDHISWIKGALFYIATLWVRYGNKNLGADHYVGTLFDNIDGTSIL